MNIELKENKTKNSNEENNEENLENINSNNNIINEDNQKKDSIDKQANIDTNVNSIDQQKNIDTNVNNIDIKDVINFHKENMIGENDKKNNEDFNNSPKNEDSNINKEELVEQNEVINNKDSMNIIGGENASKESMNIKGDIIANNDVENKNEDKNENNKNTNMDTKDDKNNKIIINKNNTIKSNNINEKDNTNISERKIVEEKEKYSKRTYFMGRRNFYKRNCKSNNNQNNLENNEISIFEKNENIYSRQTFNKDRSSSNITATKQTNNINNNNNNNIIKEDNKILNKNKSNVQIKVNTINIKINTSNSINNNIIKSNSEISNKNLTNGINYINLSNINNITNNQNTFKNTSQINSSKKSNHNQEKMNMLKSMGKSLLLGGPKKECEICHKFIESHLHKIHINSHPSQIFKWMYLGTFENACDISDLRRLGINYILNCASDCKNTQLPKSITELHLKIRDDTNFDIFKYFEQGNEFINKVRTKGGVILVHCKFGVSRSPSFVCAYLIKYFAFTLQSALKFIRKKRPIVNPNEGFMTFLEKYQKSLKKKERKKIEIEPKTK